MDNLFYLGFPLELKTNDEYLVNECLSGHIEKKMNNSIGNESATFSKYENSLSTILKFYVFC